MSDVRTKADKQARTKGAPPAEVAVDVDADDGYYDDGSYDDGAPELGLVWPILAWLLSIIGFGVSIYLTVEHFSGTPLICPAHGFIDCQKVTTSPESYLLHIPVAVLGLAFFTAMVVINFPPLWRSTLRWLPWVRLAMVVGGLGFVIYLLVSELFVIKAICLWCTSVHIDTFLLFVIVVTTFPAVWGRQAALVDGDAVDDDEADEDHEAPAPR